MKKSLLLFSCISCFLLDSKIVFSTAEPGDIAFLGYNADDPDQFCILLMDYLEDGTVISFTDCGWTSSSAFYAFEGHIQWTVPSGGLPAGTIVTFTGTSGSGFTTFPTGVLVTTISQGTLISSFAGSMSLSNNGDQILAYTGTISSPTFIAAINFNGAWAWPGTNNSEQSMLPSGLTDGTNAALLSDMDNGIVNCATLPDPPSLSDLFVASNWLFDNSIRYVLPPTLVCDFLLPIKITAFTAIAKENLILLEWNTENDGEAYVFELEKSIDGNHFYPIATFQTNERINSVQSFSYEDFELKSLIQYYRIKYLEIDGSTFYSPLVSVKISIESPISIYPNPATEFIAIEGIEIEPSNFIKLSDISGKVWKIFSLQDLYAIADLPSGFYICHFTQNGISYRISFIKT